MNNVRAPFAYSLLQDAGSTKEELHNLGFRPGYKIDLEQVLKAAEEADINKQDLLINNSKLVNKRFKSKLRGTLASYLFEYSGAFRHSGSKNHMRILGVEKSDDSADIALPSRILDAILLERTLHQVIARSRYMLTALDLKFATSEHKLVFNDQIAPGKFKVRAANKDKPKINQ
jgi:Fe-S cluster biosynthesis and repair protein YggX